jgi:cold shock CspA family protein
MTGAIVWWNALKGYGFIATDKEQYFFHATQFHGEPKVGALVKFTLAPGRPGKSGQAVNVGPIANNALFEAYRVLGGAE